MGDSEFARMEVSGEEIVTITVVYECQVRSLVGLSGAALAGRLEFE